MWYISIKEWRQFFSNLTGYIALIFFLVLNGLFLFVFPSTSIFESGYASLAEYFAIAPWILLFLIPTITMRSLSEEYLAGTFEILKTFPIKASQIAWGKFLGAMLIVLLALLPTVIYAFSLQALSVVGGIDVGSTIGSYIGLLLLGASFTGIGIAMSSCTDNSIVAFITTALCILFLYIGLDAFSTLPFIPNAWQYHLQQLGINSHYKNISRGVITLSDVLYFITIICFSMLLAVKNIKERI